MNLFEEIITMENDEELFIDINPSRGYSNVKYEEIVIEEPFECPMSTLSQFFLAPFILVDTNGILDIPASDGSIEDIILSDIAPHFNRVTKVITNKQVSLRMQKVKKSSESQFQNLIRNHHVNGIVKDIYLNGSTNTEWDLTYKEYKVNLDAVEKTINRDILPMWNFFERAFVKVNGDFVIVPIGWPFDESFKDRTVVKSFAGLCNSMTVMVNQEINMITSVLIR